MITCMKKFIIILCLFFVCVHLFSLINEKLDYSEPKSWAFNDKNRIKNIDVFYVYPTLFGGTEAMNMDVTNTEMQKRVQIAMQKQASIFFEECNIFVPYYRQMAMDGLFLTPSKRENYFSIGMTDIERAFDFFLTYLNQGRPFILAGHSQGSQILLQLMKTKFKDKALQERLIAAYLVGYSVTKTDIAEYPFLKIASNATDNGVIITYNTQSKFATNSPILKPNACCVNPLNWTANAKFASKNLHLGAVFFDNEGYEIEKIKRFTSAYIDTTGALIVSVKEGEKYEISNFPKGVYHKYDYSFFYENLKKNVSKRIKNYMKNKQR